jgi:hypothetical protein
MIRFIYLFALGSLFCCFDILAQDYFQQEVNYKINVRLDDNKHELSATETILYTNHSKDILNEIRMHIWPNAYSSNETALAQQLKNTGIKNFDFNDESIRGYIDSLDFKINGENTNWKKDSIHSDIVHIYLSTPLKPGNQISISTPFHVKIPDGMISRMGHLGQSYQITQWYPKPAVYDRNGWNDMPYLNQGEFYSEFGSFEVNISLPENYVVGASGDLQDEQETNWLNKKAKESEGMDFKDQKNSFPASSAKYKTIQFKQSSIHDFAWFADKRYHVMKGEVALPYSGKTVTLWSMFTNEEAPLWKNSIEYMRDAISLYSKWVGDYPYSQATAVYGSISAGGGMEYPNVTVIGKSENAFSLDVVIAHELGHNWFYGILGSNERIHPWMDEGINSYYENRYVEHKYKQGTDSSKNMLSEYIHLPFAEIRRISHKDFFDLDYLFSARNRNDQPIELEADKYSSFNYGAIVYAKTALTFIYLADYLGKEKFDQAMQNYYEQWKFKHPMPSDIKNSFEKSTGKNLDWFFNGVINTQDKFDYKISAYKKKENKIRIKNISNVSIPFSVSGIKNNIPVTTMWNEGFTGYKDIDFPFGEYDKLVIDVNKNIPEINRQNNSLRTKGIFRKTEPIQFKFLAGFENPSKTQIFYTPVAGWNSYDRWMAGMAFYNPAFPSKNFEYVIMPMYGFNSKNLCGGMNLSYRFLFEKSILKSIKLGVKASSYSYTNYSFPQIDNGILTMHSSTLKYIKYAPYLNLEFRKNKNIFIDHKISLRSVLLTKEKLNYSNLLKDILRQNENTLVHEISYLTQNSNRDNPWQLQLSMQQAEQFAKVFAEAAYVIPYGKKNKALSMRLFAGKLIYDKNSDYFFKMNGWNGSQDNLMDFTFIGRSETKYFPSKQFVESDGGFKIATNIGRSNNWIAALNIKIPFPGWFPAGLFADIGTYDRSGFVLPGSGTFMYDAGIMFNIGNILEIYIPLTASTDILNEQKINEKTTSDQIRFTFLSNL